MRISPRYVASRHQVHCKLDDEVALLNTKNGVYYGLNPVGARIWELIQDPQPEQAIVARLVDEFRVSRARCTRDVKKFLSTMKREGLVEVTHGSSR